MATANVPAPRVHSTRNGKRAETLADLVRNLGDIPLERIAMIPAPGTATERDLIKYLEATDKRLFELVDGTLVEKSMGARESLIAGLLVYFFWQYIRENNLGIALTADGPIRLEPGLIRIPDVSFISWDRLGTDEMPNDAVLKAIPDLAVEILSESNTRREMNRKVDAYFAAGVHLVWLINPRKEVAEIYASPTRHKQISMDDSLEGGKVFPGFTLPMKTLLSPPKKPVKNGKRTKE